MYPLEKEIATHSSILVWRIPWIEESARLQFMGSQESDTTQQLNHNQGIKRYKLLCINTIKWNMLQAVEYSFILDKTI